MEHQEIINLLDNTTNQSSKFNTKTWFETMITPVKNTTPIAKLNLKLQC